LFLLNFIFPKSRVLACFCVRTLPLKGSALAHHQLQKPFRSNCAKSQKL
jgi:hypothetical protein